jgi:hypothetical protein
MIRGGPLDRQLHCFGLFNAIDIVFIGLDRDDRYMVNSASADLVAQSVQGA